MEEGRRNEVYQTLTGKYQHALVSYFGGGEGGNAL